MKRDELIELFPVKQKHLYFNFAADGPLPVPAKAAGGSVSRTNDGGGISACFRP